MRPVKYLALYALKKYVVFGFCDIKGIVWTNEKYIYGKMSNPRLTCSRRYQILETVIAAVFNCHFNDKKRKRGQSDDFKATFAKLKYTIYIDATTRQLEPAGLGQLQNVFHHAQSTKRFENAQVYFF